ncbi:restriction endonuclease subunit S domain-containing protein [Pseudoalteromonas spongiae]|uniref:hypothetical protein n=1 Tax=Pseudoalteromonas spongiae TaxID=298657 RepID=UPI003735C6B5
MISEQLSKYADISTGRSFRGAIKRADKAGYKVIQIGDIIFENGKATIDFDKLTETEINTSRYVECLSDGDLIMVAKGREKHLLLLKNVPDKLICTQHFLVVKPKAGSSKVTSSFLKSYLETNYSKGWIEANSGGNYQSTIGKAILEKLPLPDLTDESGNDFIEYVLSVGSELEKYHQLIEARKSQVSGLINKMVKQ